MQTTECEQIDYPIASHGTTRRFSRRRVLAGGVCLLLVLGGGFLWWHDKPPTVSHAVAPRLLPVETMTVQASSAYLVPRAYLGMVMARRTSNLGFERTGKLVVVSVKEGDRIATGAPLARLDTAALLATRLDLVAQQAQAAARLAELRAGPRPESIAAARAQVAELRYELTLARSQNERRQQLSTRGLIAREEGETAATSVQTWQARLDAAERHLAELLAGTRREQVQAQEAVQAQLAARLQALDIDLDRSVLRAPFAGTVAARLLDEGTVLASGQPVLRLVDDTQVDVHIGIPPQVAARLPLASTHPVQVGQTTYTAQVIALLPALDESTRTVTAILTLPPAVSGTLFLGQTARLQVEEVFDTPGYWLPTTALAKGERGLWSCLALVATGSGLQQAWHTERRPVEVLYTENQRVFVRGVLQAGERVVKSGVQRLVAGQQVRPMAARVMGE